MAHLILFVNFTEIYGLNPYKLGFEYLSEEAYPGCALCVIAAIQDTLDFKDVKISLFYTANTV